MSFRYLHSFNLTLLDKQAWRLLIDPTSLSNVIFKHKYFPLSSILNADLWVRPSHIWQNIYQALPLLKEFLLWKVVNERTNSDLG